MGSKVATGSMRDNKDQRSEWAPQSCRIRPSDVAMIELAVAKVRANGQPGYTKSDFLADAAVARALEILGQTHAGSSV